MISPDSITTAEIRNGTIKGEDVTTVDADGLTGANVKDATLTQDDLAPNAVASSEIADGAITADDLANGSVAKLVLGAPRTAPRAGGAAASREQAVVGRSRRGARARGR